MGRCGSGKARREARAVMRRTSRRLSAVLSVSPWLFSRKTVMVLTDWNFVNCSGSVALVPLSSSVCVGGRSSASLKSMSTLLTKSFTVEGAEPSEGAASLMECSL